MTWDALSVRPYSAAAGATPSTPATPAGEPPAGAGWSLGESGGNRLEELRERLKGKIEASRVARKAGGSFRTSAAPTLNRRTESARLHASA